MNSKYNVKKLKFYIFCFWLILLVIIGAYISCGKKTETISISSGEKRELLAQSGTCGSCNWTIDNNGKLTISAGTLSNLVTVGETPWYPYRTTIKSVVVNSGVKTHSEKCVGLFAGLTNCTSINITNLDTRTNGTYAFSYFFANCEKLTSISFPSSFISTSATNINHMFDTCKSLTSINLSSFNTTNVTTLNSFFFCCFNLQTITWGSNFSTNKVSVFTNMFHSCYSLTAVGKAINTSAATTMSCMFYGCSSLTSINLSNFNTSKVTSMYKMFSYCGKIKSLDLSNFNTSKVTDMTEMLVSMDECYEIKFGEYFRFKKTGSSSVNALFSPNYYWKKSGTTESKTALQLENITGAVTGTWHRQITVVYYGNGGVWNNQTSWSERATFTETYTVQSNNNFYTRKGYTFSGWKDPTGANWQNWSGTWTYDNGQYGITSGILKLYAQWTPKTYTVRYEGNGGTWNNQTSWSNTATFGQQYTVVSNNNFYVNGDKIFIGWKDPTGANWENWSGTWVYDNGDWGITNNTLVLKAQWAPSAYTVTVKHYVHKLGENKYELYNTTSSSNAYNSNIILANYKSNIQGFTYEQGFLGDTGVTKPTTGAITSTTLNTNITISLYYRRNYLYVSYHVNGGTMASEYDSSVYGIDNSIITFNGNDHYNLRGVYGSTVGGIHEDTYIVNTNGLHDYNNPDSINIVRSGYKAVENEEWYILNNQNKTTYDQLITTYNANDMASDSGEDLGQGDVYLVLYVNWTPEEYSVTYDANGGIVDPSSKTVNFDDYYGDLAIPRKTGYSFSGWSRLPSGYKELEYIESTGTQYIDSGYKPNTRTGIDVTYQFTEIRSQERVFGVQGKNDVTSSMNYEFYVSNDLTLAYAYKDGSGNWTNLSEAADTDMHRLKFNVEGNYIKIDDTIETLNCLATHGSAYNMKIMATNQGVYSQNQTGGIASIKIFDFSIYEAGVLQKKFIPCKNSNNEAGLYDIVNGVFYGNSGTGTFIEGPEVFISSSSIVEIPFDHTLYANWIINNYTIEYYQGNNGQNEEEITLLGSSSHTYNVTANLNAYNGTIPTGWIFAGWSADGGITSTNVVYTNQQSINNLTEQSDGVVSLYAIFKRNIKFNSGGQNNVTSSTQLQYYNPYITTSVSEVLAPVPSLTGLSSYGWSRSGYRADKTAGIATYEVTTEGTYISPAYNVYDVTTTTSTTVNLYAVYIRDLTMSYNGNGNTGGSTASHTLPQRYNTSGAKTSVTFTTQANGFTKTGYTFSKWANDSASGTQVTAGSNAAAFSPAYNSNATTKTMYAIWNANTYKVEYYQGNNTTTAGATKLGESTHTYDIAQNLSTYATLKTSSGKSEPQSWVFYGWSANNGTTATTRTYTNGQSVNNLTTTNNGVIKIYAIFSRTIKFNSGLNCATTSTATQRYNPYKTTGSITAVSAPAPSMTGLSDAQLGWAPIGYRANKTAANRTYAVTTSATNITPAYNVYDVTNATATTVNLYGVYSRTVTLYHGLNKAQNSTPIQYMNTSGNAVSQILAPAPSTTGLSDYSWNAVGYRTDGGLEIGD